MLMEPESDAPRLSLPIRTLKPAVTDQELVLVSNWASAFTLMPKNLLESLAVLLKLALTPNWSTATLKTPLSDMFTPGTLKPAVRLKVKPFSETTPDTDATYRPNTLKLPLKLPETEVSLMVTAIMPSTDAVLELPTLNASDPVNVK